MHPGARPRRAHEEDAVQRDREAEEGGLRGLHSKALSHPADALIVAGGARDASRFTRLRWGAARRGLEGDADGWDLPQGVESKPSGADSLEQKKGRDRSSEDLGKIPSYATQSRS